MGACGSSEDAEARKLNKRIQDEMADHNQKEQEKIKVRGRRGMGTNIFLASLSVVGFLAMCGPFMQHCGAPTPYLCYVTSERIHRCR